MKIRVTVVVRGLVQGVAFRHHTAQQASGNRVAGWVRNRLDGSVEACFEGEEGDVHAQLEWCRRGPDQARVEAVDWREEPYTGEFAGFRIRYDHD